MKKDVKQNLQSEVLLSCLDVLCRANATVFESDPKLAADISQAIEALTDALQNEESAATGGGQTNGQSTAAPGGRQLEPADYLSKNNIPEYFPADETIVDVLTNEIIRGPRRK